MLEFEYVIIGAGSAGCVLAERLSANGRNRVAVIEAGSGAWSPWIKLPVGYGKTFYNEAVNWKYETKTESSLNGRSGYWPRGKVVGGSGSINALVYCRGLPNDFEDWKAEGATGWDWENVRNTFETLETNQHADGSRSGQGPLHIEDVSNHIHPVCRHFFNAIEELQLPRTRNCNSDDYEGATAYRINTKNGMRYSSADAFLRPALKRKNVQLFTHSLVQKIDIVEGKARSVLVKRKGREMRIQATREIILSAGAVNSPKILQLSGIGPDTLLRSHGIGVLRANDNVGGNLQDHLGINYYFKANEPTLNNQLSPLWGKVKAALRYMLTRKGPLSLSVNQCGGFFKTNPSLAFPDQQLYFNPVTYTTAQVGKRTVINPDPFSGFIIGMQPSRPTSRGRVDIQSNDPSVVPAIRPNSLATEKDQLDVIAGGKLCQRIMNAPALRGLVKAPHGEDLYQMSEDQLLSDFRARCGTVFHPVSTCKMGRDESTSVVDPELKLHGIEGLRVVDASVFPNITSGNTNAPTMMVAARAAELILKAG